MDILDLLSQVADFIAANVVGPKALVVAAIMSVMLFLCFKKTRELGRDAIQNTSATIVVYGFNVLASILFKKEIYETLQSAYAVLHIPSLPKDFWVGVPVIFTIFISVALKDLCDYLNHRLMHTRWLWPTHAAHHSDTHVNAFTTFRVHYLEVITMTISYLLLLTWLHLPDLLPVLASLLLVHNLYIHMDLPYTHGPLKYLIASPVFHRWHHADVPEAHGKNLANFMPIYDLMFGTYYVPGQCTKPMGALNAGIADKNPVKILIYPFQEWGRLICSSLNRLTGRGTDNRERSQPRMEPGE